MIITIMKQIENMNIDEMEEIYWKQAQEAWNNKPTSEKTLKGSLYTGPTKEINGKIYELANILAHLNDSEKEGNIEWATDRAEARKEYKYNNKI